jgi:hypothetical protein
MQQHACLTMLNMVSKLKYPCSIHYQNQRLYRVPKSTLQKNTRCDTRYRTLGTFLLGTVFKNTLVDNLSSRWCQLVPSASTPHITLWYRFYWVTWGGHSVKFFSSVPSANNTRHSVQNWTRHSYESCTQCTLYINTPYRFLQYQYILDLFCTAHNSQIE